MSDVTFMILVGGAAQIALLLFALFTTWALTATLRRRGMTPIQPPRAGRSAVLHEIKYLSINLTASLLLVGLGARLGAGGILRVRLDRPTVLSAVSELVLYLAGLDVYTYAVHRLMHTRWLYRHVHSVHHRSRTPSALTAFSFHPVEWLLLGLYIPLSLVTFDYHAVTLAAVVALQGFLNTLPHCGYELAPRGWYGNPILKLFATTFYHDLHHQRPTCNYGTLTTLWDRLLGTVPADFEEQFAVLKDRGSR
jgi:sterol desaturase/sphingolipid hydroxylase (fatty acid hydroxylase superfamily)